MGWNGLGHLVQNLTALFETWEAILRPKIDHAKRHELRHKLNRSVPFRGMSQPRKQILHVKHPSAKKSIHPPRR